MFYLLLIKVYECNVNMLNMQTIWRSEEESIFLQFILFRILQSLT